MKKMPYIKQEEREKYETVIKILVRLLKEDKENLAGNLNYVVTSIIKRLSKDLRYKKANEIIGALECIKLEYYRRVLAPYEDKKILENGDV